MLKIVALLVDMSARQRLVKKYCARVSTCGSRRNLPSCAIAHTAHAEIWLYANPTLHALQPCHSSKQTPLCSRVLASSTLMSNSLSNIAISSFCLLFLCATMLAERTVFFTSTLTSPLSIYLPTVTTNVVLCSLFLFNYRSVNINRLLPFLNSFESPC